MAAASSPGDAAGAPPGPRCGSVPARAAPAPFGPSLKYPSRAPVLRAMARASEPQLGRPGMRTGAASEEDDRTLRSGEPLGHRTPRRGGRVGNAARPGASGLRGAGNSRELARDPVRRHHDAAREVEAERVIDWIQRENGGTRERRLAQAQSRQGLLLADVAPHDEGRVHPLELREVHSQPRPRGSLVLVAEIHLPEAMVEVRSPEPAHEGLEEVVLLGGRDRRGERPDPGRPLRVEHGPDLPRRRVEGDLPIDLMPCPVLAPHARAKEPVLRVEALVAEPVAVGEPHLVHRLVLARHDPEQPLRAGRGRRCSSRPRRGRPRPRAATISHARARNRNGFEVRAPTGQTSITLPESSESTFRSMKVPIACPPRARSPRAR